MRRSLYEPDHEAFREVVQAFIKREVTPSAERWEQERAVDRQAWLAAGKQSVIGLSVPEEYGGGTDDFRYRCVVMEELAKVCAASVSSGFGLQDDIAIPYLVDLGTNEQKARWLPPMAAGEWIGAIAMTEPGAGSDLQGIRTTAVRDGDDWVLNGAKTFITNGINADLVIVVARTDPDVGSRGISLLVVERGMLHGAGAHRYGGGQAPGHLGPAYPLRHPWRGAPPAPPAHRRRGLCRGLLHRRPRARQRPARTAQRRMAGNDDHPRVRAVGRDLGSGSAWARSEPARRPDEHRGPASARRDDQRWIEARLVGLLGARSLGALRENETPGPAQAIIKLAWSLALSRLGETLPDITGTGGLITDDPRYRFLRSRSATIAAGTTEIMKGVLAERVLGLSRR